MRHHYGECCSEADEIAAAAEERVSVAADRHIERLEAYYERQIGRLTSRLSRAEAVIKAARELLATSTVSGPEHFEARADVCVAALCDLKAALANLDALKVTPDA